MYTAPTVAADKYSEARGVQPIYNAPNMTTTLPLKCLQEKCRTFGLDDTGDAATLWDRLSTHVNDKQAAKKTMPRQTAKKTMPTQTTPNQEMSTETLAKPKKRMVFDDSDVAEPPPKRKKRNIGAYSDWQPCEAKKCLLKRYGKAYFKNSEIGRAHV